MDGKGEAVERNFKELVGHSALMLLLRRIFDPEMWLRQIYEEYLGENIQALVDVLPALLWLMCIMIF